VVYPNYEKKHRNLNRNDFQSSLFGFWVFHRSLTSQSSDGFQAATTTAAASGPARGHQLTRSNDGKYKAKSRSSIYSSSALPTLLTSSVPSIPISSTMKIICDKYFRSKYDSLLRYVSMIWIPVLRFNVLIFSQLETLPHMSLDLLPASVHPRGKLSTAMMSLISLFF